ncbi:hypothetical protein GIB67_030992 [Kingdonia uniflora]|uniref:Uncharacterized protein n=1 Tax=Kingdonia uniflora TaxID=39325 RepID=A0A7J7L3U0_9MAGN|nr:hypothetical protein GIB67_030992 [Kingdonia uniflora]
MAMRFRCIAWVHKLLTGCFDVDDTKSQDDVHIPVSPPGKIRIEIMEQVEAEEVAEANIEFELKFSHLETEYWEKRQFLHFFALRSMYLLHYWGIHNFLKNS